jgi:hypothetical protein
MLQLFPVEKQDTVDTWMNTHGTTEEHLSILLCQSLVKKWFGKQDRDEQFVAYREQVLSAPAPLTVPSQNTGWLRHQFFGVRMNETVYFHQWCRLLHIAVLMSDEDAFLLPLELDTRENWLKNSTLNKLNTTTMQRGWHSYYRQMITPDYWRDNYVNSMMNIFRSQYGFLPITAKYKPSTLRKMPENEQRMYFSVLATREIARRAREIFPQVTTFSGPYVFQEALSAVELCLKVNYLPELFMEISLKNTLLPYYIKAGVIDFDHATAQYPRSTYKHLLEMKLMIENLNIMSDAQIGMPIP